jgi:peptidoglycan/LPS O-acetylase OafA/YrhL
LVWALGVREEIFYLPSISPFLMLEKTGVAVLCGLLIVSALKEGTWLTESVLKSRFLTSMGRYCYGIYVVHPLVIEVLMALRVAGKLFRKVGYFPTLFIYGFIVVGISLFIGFLTWHLFEKHFLKLAPSLVKKPISDTSESLPSVVQEAA